MEKDKLLYQLMRSEEFAKSYLEKHNIKKDFCKKQLDALNSQKYNIEEIKDFLYELTSLSPIDEKWRKKAKYEKEYAEIKARIHMFESVLIYLIITDKLDTKNAQKLGYNIKYLNHLLKQYHMNVSMQDPTIKDKISRMFLEFMFANKFQPENYANILELIQSVPNSLSQYLTNYRQFLLSKQVSYVDLENAKIKGARGYIDKREGIVIPKSIEADAYFRKTGEKVPNKQIPRYVYPTITDFDGVISYYDWTTTNTTLLKQITSSLPFSFPNQYIGFIFNKEEKNKKEKTDIVSSILEEMNRNSSQTCTLVHDTISNINKEFYLIKKR